MHNLLKTFFVGCIVLLSNGAFAQKTIISGNVSDKYDVIPGAEIAVIGKQNSVLTGIDGNYKLELDEGGVFMIKVSFITYDSKIKRIEIEDGKQQTLDFNLVTQIAQDAHFSLGSRAAPRTLLESISPVDIITDQDIVNSSQMELGGVLDNIITSFHSNQQTIADGTDHIDPTSLRGLGPDQILVLVNGKRRHNSSLLNVNGTFGRGTVGTDFNSIPISAIKRIEILRGGATSQYGSDAIAGVINIILKHQISDIVIDTRIQKNTEGDGETRFGSVNFGFKMGEEGFVNVSTEVRKRNNTNRAGNFTGSVYTEDQAEDNRLIEQNDFFSNLGLEGEQVMEIGPAETQNISIALNSEFKIAENTKAYFFGLRNYREGKSKGFYRFPIEEGKVVESLHPNGFLPEILSDIQDDALSFGFNTKKNLWDINFSHTIGVNRLDFSVSNSNNASLGIASPTFFDVGGYFYEQHVSNVDFSKLFPYLGGVNFAFGGEFRVENYQITAGDETSYADGGETFFNELGEEVSKIPGAQVFPGIQPINELNKFRTNTSLYFDVETKFSEEFLVNTAARYESYSDFGGQAIYKLAGRYKFQDFLNLRMGLSSGFRAPSLHQVYFNNVSTQIVSGEALQVGTFNNESAIAEAFEISKLKPELSNHLTIGFTSRIKNSITLAFDFYSINIKDRIVLSGRIDEGFESVISPLGVTAAQFLTNAIDTRTIGLDAIVTYVKDIGKGNFKSSLSANFASTSVSSDIDIPSMLDGNENVFFNREEVARVEKSQPKSKVIFSNQYKIQKFKFQLSTIYFGGVTYLHPDDGNASNWVLNEFTGVVESRDQNFSPKVLTNISLTYNVLNNLDISFFGNNVFDVYPDKLKHSVNTENGNFVYSRRVQQFGILGANYSLKLLLKL